MVLSRYTITRKQRKNPQSQKIFHGDRVRALRNHIYSLKDICEFQA